MKQRLTFEQVQLRNDARRSIMGLRELGYDVPLHTVLAKWQREGSLRWPDRRKELQEQQL